MRSTAHEDLSPVVLEYLELIYALHAEGDQAYGVTLADQMAVSRANASATVQRMVRDGLVRVVGRRIDVTEEGRVHAEAGLRRHRVTERFLVEVLGIPWAAVHEQARSFERGLSPLLEERMDAQVGYPRTCPHGNPIPRDDLDAASYLRTSGAIRLADAVPAAPLQILLLSKLVETAPALLSICAAAGLLPGTPLVVEERRGTGALQVRGSLGLAMIDQTLAARIWVTPAKQQDARKET